MKNVACVSSVCRQEPESLHVFLSVVGQLPHCTLSLDALRYEWQKYQAEDIPEDSYCSDKGQIEDGTSYVKYRRIDEYWHKVIQLTDSRGDSKYQGLAVPVKMVLSLSHGQADVERGFSLNKAMLIVTAAH